MKKLIFICGLCVIEDEKTTLKVAKYLKKLTSKYNVDFIFKTSFDKANRTSLHSFRGVGFEEGVRILQKVKTTYNIPILTDVHTPHQAAFAGNKLDILQIPAFLCRQTDLVLAVGSYAHRVNIKKGQFLAPKDVKYIIEKVEASGNHNIMITERGTCFGYHNLVVDFRSFLIMKKFGYPIIFDVTHSQQRPSLTTETGGTTEFVIPMAKAAVACGVDGLFLEVHPNPSKAKCDSATSLNLKDVKRLLEEIEKVRK